MDDLAPNAREPLDDLLDAVHRRERSDQHRLAAPAAPSDPRYDGRATPAPAPAPPPADVTKVTAYG